MTRDEAVAEMQEILGFRDDLTSTCERALRRAQRIIERGKTLPLFMQAPGGNFVTVAGAQTVVLPTGFLREVDGHPTYNIGSDGTVHQLVKRNVGDAYAAYEFDQMPLTVTGRPEVYALAKTNIRLYPTPDAAYTFIFPHYRAADILNSNIENTWLANVPEYLIGKAGTYVAQTARLPGPLELFRQMEAEGRDAMLRDEIAREEANLYTAIGSEL